jgi:hypothetical protein
MIDDLSRELILNSGLKVPFAVPRHRRQIGRLPCSDFTYRVSGLFLLSMKKWLSFIPFATAASIIVMLNFAVIAFHVLVLLKIVPMDVIWGGRLESEREMYVFESVSIAINALLITTVLLKRRAVQASTPHRIIDSLLWIFVAVFLLNTIGNLAAESSMETLIASPLTLVLAVLCCRMAVE